LLYQPSSRRLFLQRSAGMLAASLTLGAPDFAAAQVTRGFSHVAEVLATGEERNRQRDLWVLEVHFKPMRMIFVDITDPKTNEQRREQIWYLAYKMVNRPIAGQQDDTDTRPVNELDPVPQRPKVIPEFTLIAYDNPQSEIPSQVYMDEVLPEAVTAINRIEARRPSDPPLKDTVSSIRDLPDPANKDDENAEWIYGVATWRNVDPDTDFFKVIVSGISNGYEKRPGPDGEDLLWRKVLIQRFDRRGDRFDPNQIEFEFDGDPIWDYQPDAAAATAALPAAAVR
jgi:hypothetical protein